MLSDMFAAITMAVHIDTALSFALAGRRPREVSGQEEEHRLHVSGQGVFVICSIPDQPGEGFVRTYLRLGAEQQRMAREWFLDPIRPLKHAFEIGFDAARASEAPELAVSAMVAHNKALSALASELALSGNPKPPPSRAIAVAAGISLANAVWRTGAVQQLIVLQKSCKRLETRFKKWIPLDEEQLEALMGCEHIPQIPCIAGYTDPLTRAAVLLIEGESAAVEAVAVVSIPRHLRPELPEDALPVEVEAEESLESWGEGALMVPAADLKVSSWSIKAVNEAGRTGFSHIPVAWLSQLKGVSPDKVRAIAFEMRWSLQAGCSYAIRRSQGHVLLLRQGPRAPAGTVVRCGRLVEGVLP